MIFILFVDIYVEKDIVLMKRCRVILFYEMGLNFEFFVMYRSFKNLILVICYIECMNDEECWGYVFNV